MLTRLSIRNFQSLHVVDLDLEPLTVIVGPSSSGKSALVRALRTLTANARGSAFVSSWAKRTVIAADLTDTKDPESPRGTLTLTRGAKTEDNSFVIDPPPGPNEDAPPSRYTKLGGEVPPEVSRFLRIAPNDPLHFAAQFDRPFLLDDSPAEVARTLAELTNVHVIFAAAREANRARGNAASEQRTRVNDLAQVTTRIKSFAPLKDWLPAMDRATDALERARSIAEQIFRLSHESQALAAAQATISNLAPRLARPTPTLERVEAAFTLTSRLREHLRSLLLAERALAELAPRLDRPVPSLERAEAAQRELSAYRAVLLGLREANDRLTTASRALEASGSLVPAAQEAYETALREAGACPVCGQDTSHLEKIHA